MIVNYKWVFRSLSRELMRRNVKLTTIISGQSTFNNSKAWTFTKGSFTFYNLLIKCVATSPITIQMIIYTFDQ